ncbi:hypothetical protein [Subtercola lobariae]|uniref:Uncharacterized protein n=1 Tax=Subtercola lobariae TaxID=1588641 RepID=A0A917EWV9_9MICO|nr:hypothetical protein [Subtercola lobariae]GGF18087.1 hypothetical protein GCM10011399_09720 [Subtercola lobariae]
MTIHSSAHRVAFELFTSPIGEWWPVATNSVYQGTVVHLIHTGWQRLGDGEQQSRGYAEGWPQVMNDYARLFA